VIEVQFDDEADAFRNINTREELKRRMSGIVQAVSCIDGYDPDALRVDKALAAIRACLVPVTQTETVAVRDSLQRVLAQEIVPQINVPGHDNSAMDGYAVRSSDLKEKTALRQIGTAFAGKPFEGTVGAGQCVRVMTGAVMPRGADTGRRPGSLQRRPGRSPFPQGRKRDRTCAPPEKTSRLAWRCCIPDIQCRAADLGLIASLGIAT
jgi:molybdopterin molybdotransferase